MNRFFLTALTVVAWALSCAAQTKQVVEEVDANLAQLRIAARHSDERSEDVEILRRLLNKACGLPDIVSVRTELSLTPGGQGFGSLEHSQFVGDAKARTVVSTPVGSFDGVYLKGAGVVYTLRIPAGVDLTYDPHSQRVGVNAGCNKCHQGATVKHIGHATEVNAHCTSCHTVGDVRPEAKAVSEWERTKSDLRGDKPTVVEPKKAEKSRGVLCEPGTLTEQLTAQLYAHAKNLRHLGEKETITLVVTFDSLPGAMQATAKTPDKIGLTSDEVQLITLGDLHLKQGKYTDAVEAYLKGLIRFRDPVHLKIPSSAPHKDALMAVEEMTASVRSTYKSLATAYLQLGHLEDAKQALDQATSIQIELAQPTGTLSATKPGPAKLILSVQKADLDITKNPSTLRKAMQVQRINFPSREAKKETK